MAETPVWLDFLKGLVNADVESLAIVLGIAKLESGWNPDATNPNKDSNGRLLSTDYGLLQLNSKGQGAGHSPLSLYNPFTNLKIGVPPILSAIKAGRAKGLKGYDLFKYVIGDEGGRTSGHRSISLTQSEANIQAGWTAGAGLAGYIESPRNWWEALIPRRLTPEQARQLDQENANGIGSGPQGARVGADSSAVVGDALAGGALGALAGLGGWVAAALLGIAGVYLIGQSFAADKE